MTSLDDAAIAVARARFGFAHAAFDDRTEFVETVLKWLLERLGDGDLASGQSVTLVNIDYLRQSAAAKGDPVKLKHGKFVQGAIHLCNETLSRANLLPGASDLGNVQSHADALVEKQYASHVSVTFHPPSGVAHVRIPCSGSIQVIEIRLSQQPSANWSTGGLAALQSAIDSFHAGLDQTSGVGALMFKAGSLRRNATIVYRNAMYLYLRYEMGLNRVGFSVSAHRRELRVTVVGAGGFEARLKAVGTSVASAMAVSRRMSRELAVAAAQSKRGQPPSFLSCVACPSASPATQEFAEAPNSLRHRHVA